MAKGQNSALARHTIGVAVFAGTNSLQSNSANTNVPSRLTALPYTPKLESQQVLLLTLSGPLN